MTPMFSILMPYWRRAEQLHNTLVSFVHQYWGKHNLYEVVLIEDSKNWQNPEEHEKLLSLMDKFSKEIIFRYVRSHYSGWNPAPLYNLGATISRGQFLVITNPECFHIKNVLGGLSDEFHLDKDGYVVCGAQSWKGCSKGIETVEEFNGTFHRWFQHSKHWNRLFHFCSAMSKETYDFIGGFDERFGEGYGYEDDDFRDRIVEAGIKIIMKDDLVVVHQEHEKIHPPEYHILHKRNRALWLNGRPGRLERAKAGRFFE